MDSKAVQRSALCRSRRELSNEYLLAKFGFDTAENEPCKVCPLSAYRSPRFNKEFFGQMAEKVRNGDAIYMGRSGGAMAAGLDGGIF